MEFRTQPWTLLLSKFHAFDVSFAVAMDSNTARQGNTSLTNFCMQSFVFFHSVSYGLTQPVRLFFL